VVLYFISSESPDYPVKIGYTAADPKHRARELQTASPERLIVLAACDGERKHEIELHEEFAADRLIGEWFKRTPRLMDAIEKFGAEGYSKIAPRPYAEPATVREYHREYRQTPAFKERRQTAAFKEQVRKHRERRLDRMADAEEAELERERQWRRAPPTRPPQGRRTDRVRISGRPNRSADGVRQ
jgi:hypothetical protein